MDWDLLLLFSSLFVVMRGLQASGAVEWINAHALELAQMGSTATTAGVVSGVMLVLSSLISNVPAVMLWREVVRSLPDAASMWMVLAMSSTFAGNLILIGSVANLIVAERAEARGVRLGFADYARVGIPVTLLTIAWGLLVLVATASPLSRFLRLLTSFRRSGSPIPIRSAGASCCMLVPSWFGSGRR